MSGERGSSGRGRKRKRRAGGRPKKNTTPSAAGAGRRHSSSGVPSSRDVPAGRAPAPAVQTSSSGGSSSAGAADGNPVRRSSRRNNDFAMPGLSLGSARGSSERSSGSANAPSIRDTAHDRSVSTGVRSNASYQPGYRAARAEAQKRQRQGDHNAEEEEVARLARHASGASDSTDGRDVLACHPRGASDSPEHCRRACDHSNSSESRNGQQLAFDDNVATDEERNLENYLHVMGLSDGDNPDSSHWRYWRYWTGKMSEGERFRYLQKMNLRY